MFGPLSGLYSTFVEVLHAQVLTLGASTTSYGINPIWFYLAAVAIRLALEVMCLGAAMDLWRVNLGFLCVIATTPSVYYLVSLFVLSTFPFFLVYFVLLTLPGRLRLWVFNSVLIASGGLFNICSNGACQWIYC